MKPIYTCVGLCLLLSACSLLGGKPAASQRSYALEPAIAAVSPPAAMARSAGNWVLLVETPTAAAGYGSKLMVYQRQVQLLETYTQSSWVDTPASMLAPLLVQTLQAGGAFRAVLLAPSAAKAELRRDTEIVRLQQDFLQVPSHVRFSLQATLSDNRTGEVLAWQLFDATQAAATEDAAGGSAAANQAVQQVLQQLGSFAANGALKAKRLAPN